jgi:hypothetical protein
VLFASGQAFRGWYVGTGPEYVPAAADIVAEGGDELGSG